MKGTKKMTSNEKAYEHAGEILQSIRDLQTDEIFGEIDALVRKHRATASNEVVAAIAWEAYCDSCDGWDLPTDEAAFLRRFPELG